MERHGLESFLHAEEEANRLVDALTQLKQETESYKTARESLGQSAAVVAELSTRCASIVAQLDGLGDTLRAIGTPELLRGLEQVASDVEAVHRELRATQESVVRAHELNIAELRAALEERVAREVALLLQNLDQAQKAFVDSYEQAIARLSAALHERITHGEERLIENVHAMQRSLVEAHQQHLANATTSVVEQLTGVRRLLGFVRWMAVGTVALLGVALGLLFWQILSLARG
jgi:hypothetical protein